MKNWEFKREITLGGLLHIVSLIVVMSFAWGDLQKQLALIRWDLNQLNCNSQEVAEHLKEVAVRNVDHSYRIANLEKVISKQKENKNEENIFGFNDGLDNGRLWQYQVGAGAGAKAECLFALSHESGIRAIGQAGR